MIIEKKVVVASDDSALLEFLQRNLPESGYQITTVRGNGQELGATVAREAPDFVVVDIVMPTMDGLELCLRLRQWSQVPILMLSTWGAGKDKVRSLDLSADGYLTEPFGISELMARMEDAYYQNLGLRSPLSKVCLN